MKNKFKRIIAGLLVLVGFLVIILIPLNNPVLSYSTPLPTKNSNSLISFSIGNSSIKVGDTFNLDITISTDTETRGAQCGLIFDPHLVQVVDSVEGNFFNTWADANGASTLLMPQTLTPDNNKGTATMQGVAIMGGPDSGPTGNGTLLTYHIKAIANGKAVFKLSDVIIFDNGSYGKVMDLGGVQTQDLTLDIGGSSGVALSNPYLVSSGSSNNSTSTQEPTAIRRATSTPGDETTSENTFSIPWVIIVPIAGVLVIGVVGFIALRKK